jgi:hypothetical protein
MAKGCCPQGSKKDNVLEYQQNNRAADSRLS